MVAKIFTPEVVKDPCTKIQQLHTSSPDPHTFSQSRRHCKS
jgi:hypothetical protein